MILKNYLKKKVNRKTLVFLKTIFKKMEFIRNCTLDFLLSPFFILSALYLKYLRKNSFQGFFIAKAITSRIGVFPIIDHYYEPLFLKKYLRHSLRQNRNLPAIDFNDSEQLQILKRFNYENELLGFPLDNDGDELVFCYNKGSVLSGDSEYLYSMIRFFKPKKIIEIGSGYSTLMVQNAIKANRLETSQYSCIHICIEPYENPWLEEIGVKIIRSKAEETNLSLFEGLDENDILFIDSSHIIRPQGDVLYEYLEILPILKKGVLVHIHDIFSPKDYLDDWVGQNFWNEQYLLEAFLSFNKSYRIIGAANYLSHKYHDLFASKFPVFASQKDREPGSFWIQKN